MPVFPFDYIINMKDAGLNGVTFVQQCDAADGQIEIYQNDKKIQTVKVVSGEKLTVVSGKILESAAGEGEEVTEICTVENLPEGVTAESNKKSDNVMELTLKGNRTADFDEDRKVTVKLWVKSATSKTYAVTETFTISAVSDEEELMLPEGQDLTVPENVGDTKKITLTIKGGTFRKGAVSDITMTGDAVRFYSLDSASYIDPSTVELTLKYNKKFYRAAELRFEVPSLAYDEGDTDLAVTALMQPVEGFPDAIELSGQEVTLSEEDAYANVGTLAAYGIMQGNSLDCFFDVKKAGTYTVTFEITDKSGGSSKIENALGVNTGTPESPLATSPARQLIKPGLWTNKASLRCAVELQAGKQTIQFAANKDGGKLRPWQHPFCCFFNESVVF